MGSTSNAIKQNVAQHQLVTALKIFNYTVYTFLKFSCYINVCC